MSAKTRWVAVSSVAAGVAASLACTRAVDWAPASVCSDAPPTLAAPAGNELAFELFAEGVQVYKCLDPAGGTAAGGPAWSFHAPEATLSTRRGVFAGRHGAGPTWEGQDGSRVVATKVASETSDRPAIPALLLRATSHAGGGSMADVTFVQRVATWGGNAPSKGCSGDTVGAIVRVPYRAVYCFYRAGERQAAASPAATRSGEVPVR
jgi:hypothetical protein